jgi:hypothetical protein
MHRLVLEPRDSGYLPFGIITTIGLAVKNLFYKISVVIYWKIHKHSHVVPAVIHINSLCNSAPAFLIAYRVEDGTIQSRTKIAY